jgi:GGDEF domain-containing protein
VASRGAIIDRLRTEIAQARRYRHPVAVVLLDVDGFSDLNRRHGVVNGDAVLREVALRMRLRVREADALGRAGSDGFLAILPHTDEGGAATFADALRHRLAQRPMLVGDELVTDHRQRRRGGHARGGGARSRRAAGPRRRGARQRAEPPGATASRSTGSTASPGSRIGLPRPRSGEGERTQDSGR